MTAASSRVLSPAEFREAVCGRWWETTRAEVSARLARIDTGQETAPAGVVRCWRAFVAPERVR